jgi:pheromone shutdown protein TraB
MENLSVDVQSIKGFYRNRILRVLLVFILSSVGSSIGTFAGGADVIRQFSEAV